MTCPPTTQPTPSASTMSVLFVGGEVDEATAPGVRSQLACAGADPPRDVVVDLSRVTFMSPSGLRPLLETRAHLGEHLWLRRVPPPVTRLLEITGLRATFQVIDHPGAGSGGNPVGVASLAAQSAGMQQAMRTRAVIEQAKGLLMGVHDCDAEHAGNLLLRASRDRQVPVGDLAAAVTAAAGTGGEGTSAAGRTALQEVLLGTQTVDGDSRQQGKRSQQPRA